ncbi:polysaccharide deacetylase family protein [Anaeroselena agilis]|uniref:Polysaccharide deacetylase family protein n=1 Tax=Anaeroselena agilis TaxID=3063788 RepID=A0ABU3NXD1_9FIRM|nr:polysaccharide deacetylase family protein [Selenomonadales bacterium 4137-cl]
MTKTTALLRTACYGAVILLLLLLCGPPALLAFHRPPPAPVQKSALTPAPDAKPTKPAKPATRAAADGFVPAPPGGPLYDTLTVNRRRASNLPTELPAAVPYYGERTVYLTFDDGPDPDVTPDVLRILRQAGVPATFFVVGLEAEKSPDLLRQIYRDGHAIGNHSYNHVYRDLYRSPAAYTAQLRRTDDILMKHLGVRPRISRAPGGSAGSFTDAYWSALATEGYRDIGWNVSAEDASRANGAEIAATVVRQMDDGKYLWSHAIVLMHDGRGHEETARALPAIIKYFKDRNFEFRVVNLETPPAW